MDNEITNEERSKYVKTLESLLNDNVTDIHKRLELTEIVEILVNTAAINGAEKELKAISDHKKTIELTKHYISDKEVVKLMEGLCDTLSNVLSKLDLRKSLLYARRKEITHEQKTV